MFLSKKKNNGFLIYKLNLFLCSSFHILSYLWTFAVHVDVEHIFYVWTVLVNAKHFDTSIYFCSIILASINLYLSV